MFPGLRTHRPRLFETNWNLDVPLLRPPVQAPQAKMGRPPKPNEWVQVVGHFSDVPAGRAAMGIGWMTQGELAQAIPPAYTLFIGERLLAELRSGAWMQHGYESGHKPCTSASQSPDTHAQHMSALEDSASFEHSSPKECAESGQSLLRY
jgi:hypothetical protein